MAMKAWVEKVKFPGGKVKYGVRFTDAYGARHREAGLWELKSEATAVKDAVLERLFNQKVGKVDRNLETAEVVNRWLVECKSGNANIDGKPLKESTIYTYQMSLNWLIRKAPRIAQCCDEQTYKDLKDDMTEADLMPWTIAGKLKDMRNFTTWLKRNKIITTDPFENVGISRPPALPRYYSDEEIDALDRAAVGDPFHLAYWLGLKCALRRGEVMRADKRDIRWLQDGTGELTVWADESKTGAYRTVPIPACVMELIGSRGQGLLYPGMKPTTFEYQWSRLKAKAGIVERENWRHRRFKWAKELDTDPKEDQARFHDLRHTFCRLFIESGAGDIQLLSKITGHQSLDVLNKIYSHFATKVLHKAVAVVENRPKFLGLSWEKIGQFNGASEDMKDQARTSEQRDKKANSRDK